MKLYKGFLLSTIIVLLVFNGWIWQQVYFQTLAEPAIYFLNIGQGDSQLISFPSVKILIDGGRDQRVLSELDKALPDFDDNIIDLVILTHPDSDHFGGLIEVLKNYKVGAFVSNGQLGKGKKFKELQKTLVNSNLRAINILTGDKIRYQDYLIRIISPDPVALNRDNKNEASIVLLLEVNGNKVLLTGDIGFETENRLLQEYDLKSDILKVAHHGSRFSSGREFVEQVNPKISIIEVGKNPYGHPHPQVLEILASANSTIYRTDVDGTIKIILDKK